MKKKIANVHIFSLSFLFFAAAGLLFLTAMIMGIRFLPQLIDETGFRSPVGWTLAHMMTLGFMTMLAMGASFQLVQVILNTELFSRLLGFTQFGVYALGLAVLLPSFFKGHLAGIGVGGSLVAVAVLLYAFNLTVTMIRKRKWNVFVLGFSLSLLALLVTVGLGVSMGVISGSGHGAQAYGQIFVSHLWFGLGGWMSGLIVTFSFKLLPMFLVSSQKADAESWYVVGLLHTGIWLRAVSVWTSSETVKLVSVVFLLAAMAMFIRFILIVRHRARQPTGTVAVVARLHLIFAAMFGLWFVLDGVLRDSGGHEEWTEALVVWLMAGWFASCILGYLARIVPFLWWSYRFHHQWQKKSKILLKDMVREPRMGTMLWTYAASTTAVAGSIGLAWPSVAVAGLVLALIAAAAYLFELFRVFRY